MDWSRKHWAETQKCKAVRLQLCKLSLGSCDPGLFSAWRLSSLSIGAVSHNAKKCWWRCSCFSTVSQKLSCIKVGPE
jgi:hypothetical protein